MEVHELPPDAQAELAHLDDDQLADGIAWLQLSDNARQLRSWSFMSETRSALHAIEKQLAHRWWRGFTNMKTLVVIAAAGGGFVAVLMGFAPIG